MKSKQTLEIAVEHRRKLEDAAPAMLKTLIDLEMLMRINCPLPDGSPMHKEVKKIIATAEGRQT